MLIGSLAVVSIMEMEWGGLETQDVEVLVQETLDRRTLGCHLKVWLEEETERGLDGHEVLGSGMAAFVM